jgi:hypothetical protein
MNFVHDRAEARNSEVTPTFTVVSTAAHERAWWAEEAACAGTDWPSVVGAALELLVAAGIIEPEPDAMTPWDALSWRDATVEYHRGRPGRLAVEIEPKRLARLRRLTPDSVSLERAYYDINHSNPTPAVTLDAIKLAVRERDLGALNEPAIQQRLRHCDADARAQLDHWLADFRKRNCP